jgi:hypothetical protein
MTSVGLCRSVGPAGRNCERWDLPAAHVIDDSHQAGRDKWPVTPGGVVLPRAAGSARPRRRNRSHVMTTPETTETTSPVVAAVQELCVGRGQHYYRRGEDGVWRCAHGRPDPMTASGYDMPRGLTAQQMRCLRVIAEFMAERGIPPTMRELASELGLASTSSVAHLLGSLQEAGAIVRDPLRSRTIRLVGLPDAAGGGS